MNARLAGSLAVAALLLQPLRAAAHEVSCEAIVDTVETDAAGNPILLAGAVLFNGPKTNSVLVLGQYPATVGWAIIVRNLAADASVIQEFSAPLLDSTPVTIVEGSFLQAGTALPPLMPTTIVATQRIDSYEACLALGQANGIASPGTATSAPACRDAREAIFEVATENDLAYCRAKIVCMPPAGGGTAPAP